MSIERFKLSEDAKRSLTKLKTRTGLIQWNELCRWAFCVSLSNPKIPTARKIPSDSNVELTWGVFAGEQAETYMALLRHRCLKDGFDTNHETLLEQFRLHLHRGIARIAEKGEITQVTDLADLAAKS